jgi:hypothetical protein
VIPLPSHSSNGLMPHRWSKKSRWKKRARNRRRNPRPSRRKRSQRLLRPKKNPAGQRLYRRRDLDLVLRIKTLLYDERLTLEGAKKRLLIESRGPAQLDLGVRSTALEAALRRMRDQLRALRDRLSPPKT